MTAIFVSHRSSDNAEAQALKDWLEQQGHERLFLDFDPADGIPAGVDWEQRLYQELRRCQGLLIVLTPAWLESKWCGNELAIAREKGKAVFIVRMKPCAAGPVIPAIQEVDLTQNREAGLAKLARGLREHGLDPRDAFDWRPGRPIYPGLAAFDVDDAAVFFGRSEESWQVVEALRRMRLQATGSPKLLLVTGASGSGKSSLMRAGVLARLRKEPASWITARPFRRGGDALAALAEALAWAFPPDRRPTSLEAITARLTGPDAKARLLGLARELRLALDRPDATLVLALDQAEELLAERGDDAARLLDLLRTTLAVVGSEILVIATIRSDRLGAWQQHASIKATAVHAELPFEMLPLGPMPMARLGEIVRGPAAYEGLRVDDDLVDAIRRDTATPDALPLLAYTLQYLHRHFAGDGRLSLAEYHSFGGLEGSVRSQADAAIPIDKLSEADRRALREAFVPGLVRATAEGGFSRSRAPLVSLPPRAEPYLRRLVDEARLLTTDNDPQGGVTVEVAHESLLRVWPTLARWIAEDAQSLRRLEALQRAAVDWAQAGRREDYLIHRDHRLADAEALIAEPRFAARLDSTDRDYLAACRDAQNQRETAEKAAQERELRAAQELAAEQKEKTRRTRIGLVVASVLTVVAAGLGWWALDRAQEAEQQANAAELARMEAVKQEEEARHQLDRANAALATGLWNDLDFAEDDTLGAAERKALWTLAVDGGLVRKPFIAQLSTNTERMERFARRAELVGRSLGLDWPSSQQAREALGPVLDILGRAFSEGQVRALGRTVEMLLGRLTTEQTSGALSVVLDASKGIGDRRQLQVLTAAVQTLAERLTVEQARALLGPVLDASKDSTGLELPVLARAAQVLRVPLTPDQARDALGPFLGALAPETLGLQVQALAVLPAFPVSLSAEQAQAALVPVLDEMRLAPTRRVSDEEKAQTLETLASATQALAGQLTAESAYVALDPLLDTIKPMTDRGPLQALALAAQALAERLTAEQAPRALDLVRGAVAGASDTDQLEALAPVFKTLAGKLTAEQAGGTFGPGLSAIDGATEPGQLEALAPVILTLAEKLTVDQTRAAVRAVLDAIKGSSESGKLEALAPAAQALAGKLSVDEARAALDKMLTIIESLPAPDAVAALATALEALAGRLTAEQGRDALVPTLNSLAAAAEFNGLRSLLKVLPSPLTAEQGRAVLAPLLEAMAGTTMSEEQAETVRALDVPLTAEQGEAALVPLLEHITREINPLMLKRLVRTVKALEVPLTVEQERAALEHVLTALAHHQGGPALVYYLEVVQALQVPLTAEERRALLASVLAALPDTTDPKKFQALARSAQALVGEFTAEQTQAALATVRPALAWTKTTDKAADWASALVTLLPKDDGEIAVAEIVEALKYPTSAGPATNVLLDGLHSIDSNAPGKKAGLAASLAWLRVAYPTIDLAAPPACPPPLSDEQDLTCPIGGT